METKPIYKTKGNKKWPLGNGKKKNTTILLIEGASRVLSELAARLGIFSPTSPGGTGSISGLINNIAEGALEVYLASKETSEPSEPGYYFAHFGISKIWVIASYSKVANDVMVTAEAEPYRLEDFIGWVKVPIPYCLRGEEL